MLQKNNWKRQILLFMLSQNLSIFGSSVVGFSIIWYVTLKTSSGVWITVTSLAAMLPQVIISLWAGVVADRYNRKWIIMLSDGFTAAATVLAFAAFWAGYESLLLLTAVSFLRSLGGGFQGPAVNALYPDIVPEDQLVRVNGINQTLSNILLLISPAVGGVILGSLGIRWAFLVDVVTAVLAILIMSRMKLEKKPHAKKEDTSVMQELRSGIRYTWSHPVLRVLLLCYGVTFILITPASLLSPLMVARVFGGAYVAWRGAFKNKITAIAAALAGFGITFALMGFSGLFWLYLMLDCLCGMFLPVLVTAQTVLVQTSTEPAYMGRVFSLLQFVSQGVMPFAILFFGPLGDRVDIRIIIVVCGLLLALWGLWFKGSAQRACTAARGAEAD